MGCPCHGCPMNCRSIEIHKTIYWKMDKYYKERDGENYIPSKVKRMMREDDYENVVISKKKSSKINYEKLNEYLNKN